MVRAALAGQLDQVPTRRIRSSASRCRRRCPGVPAEVLRPARHVDRRRRPTTRRRRSWPRCSGRTSSATRAEVDGRRPRRRPRRPVRAPSRRASSCWSGACGPAPARPGGRAGSCASPTSTATSWSSSTAATSGARPSAGGAAHRLTSHAGLELFPKISPDGQWIAFSAEYTGTRQVYVMPAWGGAPRQLTFYNDVGPMPPRGGLGRLGHGLDAGGQDPRAHEPRALEQPHGPLLRGGSRRAAWRRRWRCPRAAAPRSPRTATKHRLHAGGPRVPHLEAHARRARAGHLDLRLRRRTARSASPTTPPPTTSPCGRATPCTSPPTASGR